MQGTFEIGGLRYKLLDHDDFDFDQGSAFEELTGAGQFEVDEALLKGSMKVWRGLLLMSIQEKNPTFTMADLGKLKVAPVIQSLLESWEEIAAAAAAVPKDAVAVKSTHRKASGSQSASASAETLDGPGTPA